MSAGRVESGHLFFLYAYDVGFDIDLKTALPLCGAFEAPGLAGLRPAPPHLQYRPKPLVVPSGTVPVRSGGDAYSLEASVKIFDFGALSVSMCLPVHDISWKDFTARALALSREEAVGAGARAVAARLFETIRPAVKRADFADIVEEYNVWHVGAFDPILTGSAFLAAHSPDIGRLLMLEDGALSGDALAEILRNPIRYFENDLLLAEWNAAVVYDPKFRDSVEVLEFLNVQMAEFRFFDRLLQAALDEMAVELHKKRRILSALHDPYERPLRRLSEIKMDTAMLRDRVHNALKAVGDAYLAKVYEDARRKIGIERWEDTTRDRLKALEDIYTILNNRAAAARGETLETIIILLILFEIIMGLLRR